MIYLCTCSRVYHLVDVPVLTRSYGYVIMYINTPDTGGTRQTNLILWEMNINVTNQH